MRRPLSLIFACLVGFITAEDDCEHRIRIVAKICDTNGGGSVECEQATKDILRSHGCSTHLSVSTENALIAGMEYHREKAGKMAAKLGLADYGCASTKDTPIDHQPKQAAIHRLLAPQGPASGGEDNLRVLERAHVAHLEKGNAGYKADAAMAIGESDEPSKFVDSEQKAFLHGYNLGNLRRQETAASISLQNCTGAGEAQLRIQDLRAEVASCKTKAENALSDDKTARAARPGGKVAREGCTDKQPPSTWAKNTCELQKNAGNCEKSWFRDDAAGYCEQTCGKCECPATANCGLMDLIGMTFKGGSKDEWLYVDATNAICINTTAESDPCSSRVAYTNPSATTLSFGMNPPEVRDETNEGTVDMTLTLTPKEGATGFAGQQDLKAY